MQPVPTASVLGSLTDEGQFEQLAMAILREADPIYRAVAHTGVNAAGRTVKCPVDAIGFVRGSDPLHLVLVHHTTVAAKNLKDKWLHDPAAVVARTSAGPTAGPGDLLKAIEVASMARSESPELKVTLALTTNQEPDPALVTTVTQAARAHGIDVDIWSRSRLSHDLDFRPAGQWIRSKILGIEQDLLSAELLRDLSRKSLDSNGLLDDSRAWIARTLESTLEKTRANVTFLLGGSGVGKSVVCFRRLESHVHMGGFGLVISDDLVAAASSLEQAIWFALQQLHPALSPHGPSALSFASPEQPLLIIIEDINRFGRTGPLAEKIARWGKSPITADTSAPSPWRLLCPIWTEAIATMGEQVRREVESLCVSCGYLSDTEGRRAVQQRAHLTGRTLSDLAAGEISTALSNDPLLIALFDVADSPDPQKVLGDYVSRSLQRVAAGTGGNTATDYSAAILALGLEMLRHRTLEPPWREISTWLCLQGEPLRRIADIATRGELAKLTGPSSDQRLVFRHDRVRDFILSASVAESLRTGSLPDEVLRDPFFADVLGAALIQGGAPPDWVSRVSTENPLALFCALRITGPSNTSVAQRIFSAINAWLATSETHETRNAHLRWFAVGVLADTDRADIPKLTAKFRDNLTAGWLARLRNGDLMGGIALCIDLEPGVTAPWRDLQIEHAKLRYGPNLVSALCKFLERADIDGPLRSGALRLAGHIGDARLGEAIEACWNGDVSRIDRLPDYLWAAAECCGSKASRLLDPICAAWASLPDTPEGATMPSRKDSLAADQLRWTFRRWPPLHALDYFCTRATQPDLAWQLEYMLHGIDNPTTVAFVVRRLAEHQRELEGTGRFSHWVSSAGDEWERAQKEGRSMSLASRHILLDLWQDTGNDKYLRRQAFTLWSATDLAGDLGLLQAADQVDVLADRILAERLYRSDDSAIPFLIQKLRGGAHLEYWWHFGRYVWSLELASELDQLLGSRAPTCQEWFQSAKTDWIASELIMRLPAEEAEQLLVRHWDHLHFSPQFVQTAIYVATERTRALARSAVSQCPSAEKLFEHVCTHMGVRIADRPGITTEAQVRSLSEYLDLLSEIDFRLLWDECNRKGWYELRRELLDVHPKAIKIGRLWSPIRAKEEFDATVGTNRVHWIDLWIDDVLQTGVSWDEIREALSGWLAERRSVGALLLVLAAIEKRGTRSDLERLTVPEEISQAAEPVVTDARFLVLRTRLH